MIGDISNIEKQLISKITNPIIRKLSLLSGNSEKDLKDKFFVCYFDAKKEVSNPNDITQVIDKAWISFTMQLRDLYIPSEEIHEATRNVRAFLKMPEREAREDGLETGKEAKVIDLPISIIPKK